ncbi:MAG TPA: permease-like cell division protein FtsX [Patescibacteria group bacterium]|nr:permease-like cell division protein FtsX [Patescibacteria group bacterium]
MSFTVFKRLVKSGVTNFFRNIWLSVAATSVMTITLFIIATILVLYTLTAVSLTNIKDKVGITAYFNNTTSETEILTIKDEVAALPGVKEVDYIPKDLARDQFIAAHQDDPLLIETLNEFSESDNPLPASFAIKANDLPDYAGIAQVLNSDRYSPYFSKIRDNSTVINKLNKITSAITQGGIGLTVVFVLVTILVMFNTIRLTIYNRREEVEIMRLVGATNWYIRGPFIIEGIMYGLLATIIASGIMILLLFLLSSRLEGFLSLQTAGSGLINGLYWKVLVADLIVGVGLGIIASSIAIRRYLKV